MVRVPKLAATAVTPQIQAAVIPPRMNALPTTAVPRKKPAVWPVLEFVAVLVRSATTLPKHAVNRAMAPTVAPATQMFA